MPDIWMDVDIDLAEVPVNIFPLTDDTDMKSIEAGVTWDQAGMDLNWNFVTTAGAFTQTNVVPTNAGVHDWTNEGHGMYAIEIPSAGGTINNNTEGFGWFEGYATGILPWRGPLIGFRAAGLNNKLVDDAYSTTRGLAGTALPDAAADAAGGLAISDAGGFAIDEILRATTPANKIDVSATGEVGLDFDNIKAATGPTTLTNITVPTVTTLTGHTAQTGDCYPIVNHADYGNAKLVRSTTPANTLDVSATGEAGLDFNNVKDATGAHTLTNITVPTVTTVTNAVSGVSGNVTGSVGSVAGSVASVAAGGIASTSFAAGAIDAAAIATGAIDSDALATTAVEEIADAVWDEVLTAATHNVASSAGRRLRTLDSNEMRAGTCQAGSTANTIRLDAGASATDGWYDPAVVIIDGGTGAGQCRLVIDYIGATQTCIVNRDWRLAPDGTSTFIIVSDAGLDAINEGKAAGGGASSITLNSWAKNINDTYNGCTVVLTSGTGRGQSRVITDYDGGTKVALISEPWATQPVDGTGYYIFGYGRSHLIPDAIDDVWDELIAGHLGAGSVGATLNSASAPTVDQIADAVWNEDATGHVGANSAGLYLRAAYALATGRLRIDDTTKQLILYMPDGVTELARWNLYNSAGALASTNVFDRQRT